MQHSAKVLMVIRVLGSCVFEVPSVAEGDSKSEMKVLAEKDVDNQISAGNQRKRMEKG